MTCRHHKVEREAATTACFSNGTAGWVGWTQVCANDTQTMPQWLSAALHNSSAVLAVLGYLRCCCCCCCTELPEELLLLLLLLFLQSSHSQMAVQPTG
jgi:hypothetical protein